MNNQQNQMNGVMMDETAQNIKNIIQPYENRIRELEEIIKQKDFEIIVLKQKLNNNNINPMMINMNMNPMNIMMGNMNQQMEDKGKEICLTIISKNKKEFFKCFEGDKVSIIKEKYNQFNQNSLTFNYKPISCNLSIKENEICDGSWIYETNFVKNIIFVNGDIKRSISLSEDCPIGIALIYYYMKFGRINHIMTAIGGGKQEFSFLYNDKELKIGDKTPIKEIFLNDPNPQVKIINC